MTPTELKLVQEMKGHADAISALAVQLTSPPPPPTPIPAQLIKPGMFGYTWTQSPAHSLSIADLNAVAPLQAAFTSSFGALDPMPRNDGIYDWTAVDISVNRMKGAQTPVAIMGMWPGWMTGAGGTFDPGANERRPLEQFFPQAAAFCGAFAKRYPWINIYALNSEWKGFWGPNNTWDVDLSVKFCEMCRTEILKANPKAKFVGQYIVLEYSATRDNNASSTWRGNSWVGDERTVQATLEFCKRFKPDILGVDFAPRIASAGFDPLFKFVDVLAAAGISLPVLSLETYVAGNAGYWPAVIKRAATYPKGFGIMMWGEAGLAGAINNPVLDAALAAQIRVAQGI